LVNGPVTALAIKAFPDFYEGKDRLLTFWFFAFLGTLFWAQSLKLLYYLSYFVGGELQPAGRQR